MEELGSYQVEAVPPVVRGWRPSPPRPSTGIAGRTGRARCRRAAGLAGVGGGVVRDRRRSGHVHTGVATGITVPTCATGGISTQVCPEKEAKSY
jgi:hypothetical protein